MMARSNLHLAENLVEEFRKESQASEKTRGFKILISKETLVIDQFIPRSTSAEHDFQLHVETINPSEPAIFLFSTAEPPGTGAWLLISFIPDVAKVREKMLYSSCREDLKRSLGASMFKAEYAANEPSELTWAAMNAYFNSAKSDLFLTEREKLVMEEKARIDAETVFTKTSMMAALPFAVDPALTAKLGELATVAAEGAEGNWLEVSFAKETLQLAATEHVGEEVTSWATFVRSEEPRFYVFSLRKSGGGDSGDRLNFLAFFCPEATPVRTKMAMSSSKATLVATAQAQGLKFRKTFEVQEAGEVDEWVRAELAAEDEGTTTASAASLAASVGLAKPGRPGGARGKPRTVAKFSADP